MPSSPFYQAGFVCRRAAQPAPASPRHHTGSNPKGPVGSQPWWHLLDKPQPLLNADTRQLGERRGASSSQEHPEARESCFVKSSVRPKSIINTAQPLGSAREGEERGCFHVFGATCGDSRTIQHSPTTSGSTPCAKRPPGPAAFAPRVPASHRDEEMQLHRAGPTEPGGAMEME